MWETHRKRPEYTVGILQEDNDSVPSLPDFPPGRHKSRFPQRHVFSPPENPPKWSCPCDIPAEPCTGWSVCFHLIQEYWQYFGLKVEERRCMRDLVYCLCVFCVKHKRWDLWAGEEKQCFSQNRVVTMKEKLRRGVNKLFVSHIPLPILSSLQCLSNLHPALLPEL